MENQEKLNVMPRIGDIAPDFEAVTTTGHIKFSEYNKGNLEQVDWYLAKKSI